MVYSQTTVLLMILLSSYHTSDYYQLESLSVFQNEVTFGGLVKHVFNSNTLYVLHQVRLSFCSLQSSLSDSLLSFSSHWLLFKLTLSCRSSNRPVRSIISFYVRLVHPLHRSSHGLVHFQLGVEKLYNCQAYRLWGGFHYNTNQNWRFREGNSQTIHKEKKVPIATDVSWVSMKIDLANWFFDLSFVCNYSSD